ncbi:M14 family zinc carboxypeptidase [Sediminicola luteus]|uniref:Zinc carboxypeptidase n=1 Tax=Sediminicola luteus TaxID=319238 RepID=A0A2A4G8A8_9FLAO|nr:M14 family zinc carboxypeptidase [Sediminicola luteus]PCE64226.1 zinc carboxypeptidase [Sediminicola luteus]
MIKKITLHLSLLLTLIGTAQQIKSPAEFLGYELGSQFTRSWEVREYYEYLAETVPNRVSLQEYGTTNERRPLLLAYVSSASNMAQLDDIRKKHLESTQGKGQADKAIVWLSYNVHGNESVSTEASMQTIYELLTVKKDYLENTVVLIDPCINPDGRDRYVNWYNQYKNAPNNVDPNSKEHHEGWWSGRSNHYMFDLNRDWAWLTQVESQQRIKVYNTWMPHVHVDFHEQGVDSPYYFAPAAEPYHEVITDFQRNFQTAIGKNHAKYFDEKGWFYFTKEFFDLFYPSYGDTYPTYNGGIGMTYEQGGSGRAGLGIITSIKDTLTLGDRIAHHHTTGLSTVEMASKNAQQLNDEFRKFFKGPKNYKYKNYVLQGNPDHLEALTQLLAKHEISYFSGSNGGTAKGFDYANGKAGSMRIGENSLVVPTDQTKGTMVKVLFEPNAKLSDSLTYDITAWSLPYAYGLNALATSASVSQNEYVATPKAQNALDASAYGYVTDWNSMKDARFLADALKAGIRVRFSDRAFYVAGTSFERGSLIITRGDNKNLDGFLATLADIAEKHGKSLTNSATGFVDKGKDFGSPHVSMINDTKIAVLSGEPTSTLRFGEVWHFFEQQLHYPITVLDGSYFKKVDLKGYDVLILPSGYYGGYFSENDLKKLKDWVRGGGKLIAMGGALNALAGKDGFGLKRKDTKDEDPTANKTPQPNDTAEREYIKQLITGAIFKTKVDHTDALAFGYPSSYHTLKLGSDAYGYLERGNAVYLEGNEPVSGFAGSEAKKKIGKTLVFGSESMGRGSVVYMVDNPLFRGFWENGKLFFANALFMVQ